MKITEIIVKCLRSPSKAELKYYKVFVKCGALGANVCNNVQAFGKLGQNFQSTVKRLAVQSKRFKHFWTFGGSGPNFKQQTLESVARSGPNIWKSDERLGTRAQAENKNC